MITLYSGTPGSGKSLYTAYDCIFWLNRGKKVIANFPIKEDYFKKSVPFTYVPNTALTPEYLYDFAKNNHVPCKESQTLLIIDECGGIFNARCWDAKNRLEWIDFFSQHRKLGYDVILIAQNDRMIDRQIRNFIETEYKYRAIKHYKMFGFLISCLFGGMFVRVEYWYSSKLRCSSQFFLLHRKKAKIYDTYKVFEKP